MKQWNDKIRKLEVDIRNKDDNKEVCEYSLRYAIVLLGYAECQSCICVAMGMPKLVLITSTQVALGTSKINYCDPRISVAWCKRCDVPIERIFPKTLRDKFVWAMSVPPDWSFKAIA